jgi:hypothetical protein
MWGRGRWPTALATLVTLVALVGCGGGSSGGGGSPKDTVLTGVDGVVKADRLTTTIRLDTTPQALQALASASGDSLDPNIASIITGANIVVETVRGSDGTALDLRGVANGKTLVELRSVNDTLYIQGDVEGIFTLINKPRIYANLRAETKSMPSFIQAAVSGQWVSLPASTLNSLSTFTGGAATSSAPSSGPKLLTELRQVIDQHVTVTQSGSDSRGTHYVLKANTRELAKAVQSAVQNSVPGGGVLSQRLPTNVKSQNFSFDAWVNGGALTELSINLLQFGDTSKVPSGATLPLTITFERTGEDITAPTDVTPVDLTQLGTLIGALQGSG